jgi:multidrug efflux pump subunit AcrA (membrane-fusion protein)
MELEVPVNVSGAQWIHIGSNVKVSDTGGTRNWIGRVVRKAKFVDSTTQSIAVFIQLTSPAGQPLLKNLYLKAFFQGVAFRQTMEIPRAALIDNDYVYVVGPENRLRKKKINLHLVKAHTAVISGLEVGRQLVTEPLLDAQEGTKVNIGG